MENGRQNRGETQKRTATVGPGHVVDEIQVKIAGPTFSLRGRRSRMAEVSFEFLQHQQEKILLELATMRLEHRSTAISLRDDVAVLTSMVQRLEHASRNQQDVNTLILYRLLKFYDRRGGSHVDH
jgi:hypothetical protein